MLNAAPVRLARRHYMDAILVVLDRVGGRAPAREVGEAVRRELDRYMTEIDLGGVPSNPNDPRWWNDTRWARDCLVDAEFLASRRISGHGVWSLTASGRAEALNARARLDQSSQGPGGGERTGRSPVTPGRAARLSFLAAVFRRAHETPVGGTDHRVMLDLMQTLEELVAEGFSSLTQSDGGFAGPRGRTSMPPSNSWHPPPTPTGTRVPNTLDPVRMTAFIEGPWLAAVARMARMTGAEKAARIEQLDMLASLPAVATLVAVRSAWIGVAKASELAVRSVRVVMTEHDRPGGLVGGLQLGDAGETRAAVRDGLFHRALTGWVQQLDLAGDDAVALRAGVMRAWLVSLRSLLGEPEEATGPRHSDPLWAWLFDADPTFEPPREGGAEDFARELSAWLATLPLQTGAREAPNRGTLLWHRLFGWALAVGDHQARYDESFGAHILSTAEEMRLGRAFKAGWIDVNRATTSGCPVTVREAAERVAVAARHSWGAT